MRYGTSAAGFSRTSRVRSPAWRSSERLGHRGLCTILQFMDEGQISHYHAKCLRPIHSAENLSSDSLQFIRDLVGQRKDERGIDSLKWNVQPRAVIERKELRLRRLGLETHDDVLCEGVLSPDFEHGKELIEMDLGESGIDG
ncbi:MAG: hypothetical protein WBE03_02235 [Terracidiphilus sp.]